jgi:3-dehydroquinate dehydratase
LIQSPVDADILRTLLRTREQRLLSCVAMGEKGPALRVELALHGSCLTYGFADETNAPGQISSEDLLNRLRAAGAR